MQKRTVQFISEPISPPVPSSFFEWYGRCLQLLRKNSSSHPDWNTAAPDIQVFAAEVIPVRFFRPFILLSSVPAKYRLSPMPPPPCYRMVPRPSQGGLLLVHTERLYCILPLKCRAPAYVPHRTDWTSGRPGFPEGIFKKICLQILSFVQ